MSYLQLEKHLSKLSDIYGALAVLHWDFATMMPEGGAKARSEQLASLQQIAHEILTDKKLSEYIKIAKKEKLGQWQKSNLGLAERSYIHATCVPTDLVAAISKAGSECEMIWRTAKAKNDFKSYAKPQQKVLNLAREVAAVKAQKLGLSKYDALLDQYDAGRRSKDIDVIFADLKNFLPKFLDKALTQQSKKKIKEIKGQFPVEKQRELGEFVVKTIGFDFKRGRLDVSHHPFCGGISSDVRITTRYDERDFSSSLMGVIHETGHAMYELGLPEKWQRQPVGGALGMSIHESQSLLMEMQVCRSIEFFKFILPYIKKTFAVKGDVWNAENIKNFYCRVERSFIRVDADEVTYPLHVILRYELEKLMINGDLEIKDLPDAWNEKMQKYLGIKPKNFAEGCMQDIHWTDGSFGYFPTYTLGAITAAQFFSVAKKQIPTLLKNIEQGNFKPLVKWLKENIHSQASLYTADELTKKVTGEKLNVEIFKKHLQNRYID